jgi:hypothetical protein
VRQSTNPAVRVEASSAAAIASRMASTTRESTLPVMVLGRIAR